jgi:hypothetical protein
LHLADDFAVPIQRGLARDENDTPAANFHHLRSNPSAALPPT